MKLLVLCSTLFYLSISFAQNVVKEITPPQGEYSANQAFLLDNGDIKYIRPHQKNLYHEGHTSLFYASSSKRKVCQKLGHRRGVKKVAKKFTPHAIDNLGGRPRRSRINTGAIPPYRKFLFFYLPAKENMYDKRVMQELICR